jgi:hyperosmotically inducible periplasmic protein
MKLKNTVTGIAAMILLTAGVHAQTSSSDATAAAPAASPAPSSHSSDRATNRAFARRVQKAIFRTKGLEDTEIVVFAKAKTGDVTLAGFIVSEDQDQLAQDAAKKVPGVKSVTSKLTLQEDNGG